jgi:hypothetical protein
MESVNKYNDLDGKKVSREYLKELLDLSIIDNNQFVHDKILSLLMNHKDDSFLISIKQKAKTPGLGKPMPKVGIAKIALDECGRLRKGFKFVNGKIVKVEAKTKAKPAPKTTKPSVKPIDKNVVLEKHILSLATKYGYDSQSPKITN